MPPNLAANRFSNTHSPFEAQGRRVPPPWRGRIETTVTQLSL